MWSGPDGYLRPDQFLDHLTVIKNEQKVSMFILNFRLFKAIFFLRIGKDFPPNWDRFLKSKMEGSPNVFHQRNWPSIRKF